RVRRVAVVVGTRPEAIKLAPVVHALRRHADLDTRLVATAQHREMLDQALATFGLAPDVDLDLMRAGQGLAELTARLLTGLAETFATERPDLVLVQGDTSTVLTAALAAFYARVPVGHVEAGLRSGDLQDPFPEEANRRLAGVLATLHFAPTERARRHLIEGGVPPERVILTGNTVIDALRDVVGRLPPPPPDGRRLLLLTVHRRENWGEPIRRVCRAVREVLEARPDVGVVFPVHRNPIVREVVWAELGGHPRAELREPADYRAMVDLERRCYLALTDSGGLQEELPSLGKPVLVLRETTERPEAVEAGCARLVGTAREAVAANLLELLDDPAAYAAMARVANPFGDGHASERIVAAVRVFLGLEEA
ncbi:MAG TPA: UDP-N-acetylglucosamine 2-epimerase (non-hydrolyzing), partial [Chloroflexota bacterium]